MVQYKAMTAGHCIENRMCSTLLLESVVHYFQQYFLSWLYTFSVAYSILWPGLPWVFWFIFYFNWKVLYLDILWGQGQRWGTCFLMFCSQNDCISLRCHMVNVQAWVIPGTTKQACSRYMPGRDLLSSMILLKPNLGKWKQCHKEAPLWNYIL